MAAARKIRDDKSEKHEKETVSSASHEDSHHDMDLMSGGHKKAEEGEGPWLVSYADLMTLLMGFFALIASFSKPDAKEFDKVAAAASEYFGGEYQAPYEGLAQSLRRVIKENELEGQVNLNVGSEGIVMTFTGTLFFDSGGYKVKTEAVGLMDKLIKTVKTETRSYNAMIEGHTDSVPINDPIIASNWELSAIRAARIAQLFEAQGFRKDQLTIMGWGETRPVASNDNDDGSPNVTNRSKNRRVVLRIYKDLPK